MRRGRFLLVLLALLGLTMAAYWPVLGHGFFSFDDETYVSGNPMVRGGFSLPGLAWAFTSLGYASNWHPLTWLSHMADAQIWGLAAGGHHLTSLLLHLANTALFFAVIMAFTGAFWRAALVAALFALHPLHVESVAWISERKDLLLAFFWLLTLAAYLRYVRAPRPRTYLPVVLLFSLALLAKPMAVTLPFVLLLLDGWPLGRWRHAMSRTGGHPPLGRVYPAGERRGRSVSMAILEKTPLLILSAASSVVTWIAQQRGGLVSSLERFPFGIRAANAAAAYVAYLGKMLWPVRLGVFYPHPEGTLPLWKTAFSLALLAGLSGMALLLARRRPYASVGWAWYLGTLVPVIGLVQVGVQSMADRYSYLPLTGIFLALVWGLGDLAGGLLRKPVRLAVPVLTLLTLLALRTRTQIGWWGDDAALFRRTLQVTEGNWLALNNLGAVLARRGLIDEAISNYRKALEIKPASGATHNNLGNALLSQGRVDEALSHYMKAMRYSPLEAAAYYNTGVALSRLDRTLEAEAAYRQALRISPSYHEALDNLGVLLMRRGAYGEALAAFEAAARQDPADAWSRYNAAEALALMGRAVEAAARYREALRLQPGLEEARRGLERLAAGGKTGR